METMHTPGPWRVVHDHPNPDIARRIAYIKNVREDGNVSPYTEIAVLYGIDDDEGRNNASLVAAAPELQKVCSNFQINGPDADGLVWLVLHGKGTTGKAMINLGSADRLAAQVALHLERDRRNAIESATHINPEP